MDIEINSIDFDADSTIKLESRKETLFYGPFLYPHQQRWPPRREDLSEKFHDH
mgnify:CR=1 FL=1